MVGLLAAWSLLLAVAGAGKMARPRAAGRALRAAQVPGSTVLGTRAAVRLTGFAEICIALGIFVVGGAVPTALLTAGYLLLTLIAWRMLRVSPGQDCGCFGRTAEPITRWHLLVNAAGIIIGAAAMYWPQPSVLDELIGQDATGRVLFCALVGLLGWLCYLTMTALPALLALRAPARKQDSTQPRVGLNR